MPKIIISRASREDAEGILALQKLAYQSEATLYNDWSIPPLTQSLESLLEEFAHSVIIKASVEERLVGAVRARARVRSDVCEIGRLIVDPQAQRQGVGSNLLSSIEARFPDSRVYELFTGERSESNIRLYRRHGYTIARTQALSSAVSLVYLRKLNASFRP